MSMIGNFTAIKTDTLEAIMADPSLIDGVLYPDDDSSPGELHIDVDKAWDGIDFLLGRLARGDTDPLCHAVMGGVEHGEDVGYGPARILVPHDVSAIASAISRVSTETFAKQFDASQLKSHSVYPEIWDEGQEALDYLTSDFQNLKSFYQKAAESGFAVLAYLN